MRRLRLALPGGVLDVSSNDEEVIALLATMFAGMVCLDEPVRAAMPLVRETLQIQATAGGYRLGPHGATAATRSEVLVWVDDFVRLAFAQWNAKATQLHASCVIEREWTVLITGDSGSGKSSLAHAAVRAGAAYWSDEYALLDERGVAGLARAIQYDAVPVGSPAPAAACDMSTYQFRGRGGVPVVRPLVPVPGAATWGDVQRLLVVFPRIGEVTAMRALSGAAALPRLLAQVTHGPFVDLLPLLQRTHALTWHDADAGWRAVCKAVAALG